MAARLLYQAFFARSISSRRSIAAVKYSCDALIPLWSFKSEISSGRSCVGHSKPREIMGTIFVLLDNAQAISCLTQSCSEKHLSRQPFVRIGTKSEDDSMTLKSAVLNGPLRRSSTSRNTEYRRRSNSSRTDLAKSAPPSRL